MTGGPRPRELEVKLLANLKARTERLRRVLEEPPNPLPSGYAALLYLYELR